MQMRHATRSDESNPQSMSYIDDAHRNESQRGCVLQCVAACCSVLQCVAVEVSGVINAHRVA